VECINLLNYTDFPTDPTAHSCRKGTTTRDDRSSKEDILSRIGELGINVKDGKIIFNPRLLRRNEFYKLKRYLIM
jgi:hypothetical protein